MLTLQVGGEIILYFNNKEHKAIITQVEFGEIVWVRFEEGKNEQYYHIDELTELTNPKNISQPFEIFEEWGQA